MWKVIALVLALDAAPLNAPVTFSGGEHGGVKVKWNPTPGADDSGLAVMVLADGCKYRVVAEPKTKVPTQAVYIGGGE